MPDLREHLQNIFGLEEFRPAQREVIEDIMSGRDVLCVMPTGAGKSLCYQLPAAISNGLAIVVSPLISLMEDQVQQLRDEGIPAAMLNSSMTGAIQRTVMAELADGFTGMLYVAPERFYAPNFQSILPTLKPKLLAIDEAHCISQWGHDFRPEYARLGEVRRMLGEPPVIALTATATEDVRGDIIRGLGLREPSIVITGFDRPNLRYESRRSSKVVEKDAALFEMIDNEPGGMIVYCATRKTVDELTAKLRQHARGRLIVGYHAGMDAAERTGNQEQFMSTDGAIAVATNAFGMGINKPNIRLVVHYNVPGTLEAYYQEAGRAGRDGQPARCALLYSYQDRMLQEFFIDKIGEGRDGEPTNFDPKQLDLLKSRAKEKLEMMFKYGATHACRRRMILDYFGDESDVVGCDCDICAPTLGSRASAPIVEMSDAVVTLVRQLLSAIARLNGRFGVGAVAEVLAGSTNERSQRFGLESLSVFGLLKQYPIKKIVAMVHRVIEAGLARQKNVANQGRPPMYVVEITTAGVSVMKGTQPPPAPLADIVPRATPRQTGTNPRALGTNPRNLRDGAADEDVPLDTDASARFERLRSTRTQLARERNLPPYVICHDATLKLIARHAPDSLAKLETIKGMGPFKVKTYGEAILSALRGNGDAGEESIRYVDE